MADDKSKRDGRDSSRVAAGQDYEVEYFARHHGISQDEARQLIKEHGTDRAKLTAAVLALKNRGDGPPPNPLGLFLASVAQGGVPQRALALEVADAANDAGFDPLS